MTICPIAIAVGCKKCPAFKFCPFTTLLGDQEEKDEYQRYAEEELEKNTKEMESFKGEDAEVIPERNKMKKEERFQKSSFSHLPSRAPTRCVLRATTTD